MKNSKVIDFKHIQYEKQIRDLINEVGLDAFKMKKIQLTLSCVEKEILAKCIKYTIITLMEIMENKEDNQAIHEEIGRAHV